MNSDFQNRPVTDNSQFIYLCGKDPIDVKSVAGQVGKNVRNGQFKNKIEYVSPHEIPEETKVEKTDPAKLTVIKRKLAQSGFDPDSPIRTQEPTIDFTGAIQEGD